MLFSPKAFPFSGPLPAKNQFPLFLPLNSPSLETASYDNSISFNSGFMDAFLSSFHKTFGFPDYGRSGRPGNDFLCTSGAPDFTITLSFKKRF